MAKNGKVVLVTEEAELIAMALESAAGFLGTYRFRGQHAQQAKDIQNGASYRAFLLRRALQPLPVASKKKAKTKPASGSLPLGQE